MSREEKKKKKTQTQGDKLYFTIKKVNQSKQELWRHQVTDRKLMADAMRESSSCSPGRFKWPANRASRVQRSTSEHTRTQRKPIVKHPETCLLLEIPGEYGAQPTKTNDPYCQLFQLFGNICKHKHI